MSRESVLARGRAAAAAGMVDRCTIVRVTATSTDAAGRVLETVEDVYPLLGGDGRCRVQETFGFSRETRPSQDQNVLARYRVLQLPVEESTGVRVGDRVTITACVNDPDLVDVVMLVRDQSGKTEATSRRVGVEEITG